MTAGQICDAVAAYYAAKLAQHGATARGVDWNSPESQHLRFDQLLKLLPPQGGALIDYGCGYGALLSYLRTKHIAARYQGFDIAPEMVACARQTHAGASNCSFVDVESELEAAEYAVASGIFNVRMDFSNDEWQSYVLNILQRLSRLSIYDMPPGLLPRVSSHQNS